MKYYGKAEQVAQKILDAFKNGDVPKALAPVFIRRKDGVPCRAWSWGNQLVCILNGTTDARGIRQWNDAGRKVKKGSKAFDILVPLTKTVTAIDPDTGKEVKISRLYGFGTAPVFAVEGAELPKIDQDVTHWLDETPLVEVARTWGLNVGAYDGQTRGPKGKYLPGSYIALGVRKSFDLSP